MKTCRSLLALLCLMSLSCQTSVSQDTRRDPSEEKTSKRDTAGGPVAGAGTRLTLLAENHALDKSGLKAENGFCLLVEKGDKSYLYDAGRDGVAVHNAAVLGKSLTKVENVFLSHGHLDHTGGLVKILEAIGHPVEIVTHPGVFDKKILVSMSGRGVPIGIPFSASELTERYKATVNFQTGFTNVGDGVWLTGEVPMSNKFETIPAQSRREVAGNTERDLLLDDNTLVIETPKGLVVAMACAHRGVINILTHVRKTLNKPILAIIGGMHLEMVSQRQLEFEGKELRAIVREDHVQVLAPCHCTGRRAASEMKNEFKDIYRDAHVGTTFEFP